MLLNSFKKLYFLFIFFFACSVLLSQNTPSRMQRSQNPSSQTLKAGSFIDVNAAGYPESNYDITQLVKDVLIKGGSNCFTPDISNVMVSPNLAAGNATRTWGYFNKGTTNFPFEKGIVLVTGQANKAGNAFISQDLSDTFSSNGDADLSQALNVPATSLKDNTYIEFDFVALSTKVRFRYLLASEEYYGAYPCNYTDGFALLLKKQGDPTYTNLAVLPGGGGTVSVKNIHPAINTNNGSCAAVNQQYFGGYNTANIETNFNGRTIPLTAEATVIPGQTYHFKLVLADYQDTQFDTAVFLEAGSFDIGVQLLDGNGVALPSSITMCDNTPTTLVVSAQAPNATYQWFLGTNPIPGATSATYVATQPGVYRVEVTIPGNSCPGIATVTIVGATSPTVQNATLTACYSAGNIIYDLTSAQPAISTGPGTLTFSYYTNLADAQQGNNSTIPNPTAYSSPGGQTVYVLVKNGSCSKIAELSLQKAPQMIATIAPPAILTCANSQTTLNASASTYQNGATFNWTTTGGNIVSGGNTLNPVINAPGTYTLTISNTYQPGDVSCSVTASVVVTGDSAPPNTNLTASSINICAGESVTLTASGGTTYTWGNGLTGTGTTQTVSPTTTTTYTVTAVGANGCASANPATITITVGQPITAQNASLSKCFVNGGTQFDLTQAQAQLTSDIGVNFAYYDNLADANLGNANTIPTNYTVNATQTVYVLITRGGCKKVVSLTLNVSPPTILTISPPATINCTVPTITLDASGSTVPTGSTIAWTTTGGGNIVSGGNTLTPVVNQGGTYTLTVTNTSQPGNLSCSFTATATVVKDVALPAATLTSSVPRICVGESVTLTAFGGVSYNWGGGLTGNGNTQTVSPTTTTTYTVYAVGANGCVSANPATVTVIVGPPTAAVTADKLKICAGESVTLTATGGITYNWVGLNGNGPVQVVSPTTTTTYSVYALGGNGCSSVNPATITIEVVPGITSSLHDVYICPGETATLDAGSQPGYTYLWNTGETTSIINTTTLGTYSVTISNGTCSKVFTAQVLPMVLPQITDVQYNYDAKSLTITAENPTNNPLEYSINDGVNWQSSNIFYNVMENSNYKIHVRVKDAKCGTILDYFTFVVTNAITPNGDGKNDYVDFTGIANYANFSASVFDRYGSEVFRATNKNPIWNGTVNGYQLPTGTYWYKVNWINPASKKLEERSGWILVKNRN